MKKLTNRNKRSIAGFLFVLPWLVGFVLFFLQAIFQLVRYSFCNFKFSQGSGYVYHALTGGIFEHYKNAFLTDSLFPQKLFGSFGDMIYRVPVILVFSLFVAIVLNQEFKGRSIMRAVFFVPILISCGVIASMIKTNLTSTVVGTDSSNNIFSAALLTEMLSRMGMASSIVNRIGSLVSNVTDLVWGSSVQIIVFLMGLLTIPQTYYEVANVEGATGWESFWKVTFPAVSPYILVNIIYTCVDYFINYDNIAMKYISEVAFNDFKYSYAAALSWIYFVLIIIALVLIVWLTSLFIPFIEKKPKPERNGGKRCGRKK